MPCATLGTTKCRCQHKRAGSESRVTVHMMIRALFNDHAWWTVQYMTATLFHLPFELESKKRLVANQIEIGHELGKYYFGKKVGQQIGQLFTQHIIKADQILQALKQGDKLQPFIEDFLQQGDQMSLFIAEILHVRIETLKREFRTHNKHVIQLASLIQNPKKSRKYINELDAYQNHMMYLADFIFKAASAL
jgi:hypothetical protein